MVSESVGVRYNLRGSMAQKNDSFPTSEGMEKFSEEVRQTAYFLWDQDGRPSGRADEYWYRALDQHIRARASAEALEKAPPDAQQG